jgi:hypothetical protein
VTTAYIAQLAEAAFNGITNNGAKDTTTLGPLLSQGKKRESATIGSLSLADKVMENHFTVGVCDRK